jgi:hypothetical protein
VIGAGKIAASPAVRPFFNRGGGPPAVVAAVVGGNSNPTRVSPDPFSPPGIIIAAGDVIVVCAAQRNCLTGNPPVVTIDGGGAPVVTLAASAVGFPARTVDTFLYFITGAAGGTRTVTVNPNGDGTTIGTGFQAALVALRGSTGLDKTATSVGTSVGPYVVGPTAALTVPNQRDIAVLGLGDAGVSPLPWVAPFADRINNDGFDPTGDVSIWVADRTSLTTAAVTATSSSQADNDNFAMCLATFKGT